MLSNGARESERSRELSRSSDSGKTGSEDMKLLFKDVLQGEFGDRLYVLTIALNSYRQKYCATIHQVSANMKETANCKFYV